MSKLKDKEPIGGGTEPKHDYCTRSEEHTSELQSQSTISYAVFCLKKKKQYAKSSQKRGRHLAC